jgi:dienelactone hydrolase
MAAVAFGAACGGNGSEDGFGVTSRTISHETTRDIVVLEPDAEGPWPEVVAFHGINGSADQMVPLGKRLAATGAVVFAPNFRTDLTSEQGVVNLVRDAECGYRYVRTIASDHGGDGTRALTWIGWSLGAVFAVQAGLDESIDPSGEIISCFADAPRPDNIVAISGCYYDVGQGFDPAEWANKDARITVIAAENDTVCPASESERVTEELRARGYDVHFVMLEDADHYAPVFHRKVNDELVISSEEPAGEEVVRLITDLLADH